MNRFLFLEVTLQTKGITRRYSTAVDEGRRAVATLEPGLKDRLREEKDKRTLEY